jgi:hypothetical protein
MLPLFMFQAHFPTLTVCVSGPVPFRHYLVSIIPSGQQAGSIILHYWFILLKVLCILVLDSLEEEKRTFQNKAYENIFMK